MLLFSFYLQAGGVGETRSSVPATLHGRPQMSKESFVSVQFPQSSKKKLKLSNAVQ
jgi:hypothetical protein